MHPTGDQRLSDKPNSEITAKERLEMYYADLGNTLDPAQQFANILVSIGDQLDFILGQEKADQLMEQLCSGLGVLDENDDEALPWRNLVRANSRKIVAEHPGGDTFFNVLAYAQFGIVIDDSTNASELSGAIDRMIEELDAFRASYDAPLWNDQNGDQVATLLNWAKGRQALDKHEPIEPAGLALLGGVNERSIRNLMSRKQKGLRSTDGKVRFEDAENWLSTKRNFWNSVWLSQDFGNLPTDEVAVDETYVFVPVSRDGSVFHPGLKGTHGYRVGPKGDQIDFGTYDDALQHLQSMAHPYWSRKNPNGVKVLLSGIRWERLGLSELEKFASDPERRLQTAL